MRAHNHYRYMGANEVSRLPVDLYNYVTLFRLLAPYKDFCIPKEEDARDSLTLGTQKRSSWHNWNYSTESDNNLCHSISFFYHVKFSLKILFKQTLFSRTRLTRPKRVLIYNNILLSKHQSYKNRKKKPILTRSSVSLTYKQRMNCVYSRTYTVN